MKIALPVIGIILLLVGALWTLQGLGIVKGGFMSGQALWLWVGVACVILGAASLVQGVRLRGKG